MMRTAPTLALLGLATLLAACGGGGGDGDDVRVLSSRTEHADPLAAVCALPRSGNDPYNGNRPYPDRQGGIGDEKAWLNAYMHDVYLWYREIPNVNAAPYTVANYGGVQAALHEYFRALLTPAVTPSGKYKDQFSFTYPTDQWNALSQGGVEVGYGLQFAALATYPPRDYRVAYVYPAVPSGNKVVARGARVLAIDGVSIDDSSDAGIDTLSAGLFPDTAGEQHSFRVLDDGSSTPRNVVLTAAQVTSTPVQNVHSIATSTGSVGYMLFNDHIATAEGQLIAAVQQLKNANVSDLVLDMRYNGGGYLDIASELAYMIAGPARTTGKTFERLRFSDQSPLNDSPDAVTPFRGTAVGFDPSVTEGTALPQLGLSRVYVLVGPGTCSASEAVVNGLRGVDVQVLLIGDTTCGKPYGFFAQDNCGLSYFAIEFSGFNAKGFGDYADGFAPTCT
ncbi:MAG: S41 family peptidase, partial [Solimonas sp.]